MINLSPYECTTFLFSCWKGKKINNEDKYIVASRFAVEIGSEALAPYALLSYMEVGDLKEFDKFANSCGESPDFKKCITEIVKKEKLPTWQSRVATIANAKSVNDWLFKAAIILIARDLNAYGKLLSLEDNKKKVDELNTTVKDFVKEVTSKDVAEDMMCSVFGEDTKIEETVEQSEHEEIIEQSDDIKSDEVAEVQDKKKVDAENAVSMTLQSILDGKVETDTHRSDKPTRKKPKQSTDVLSFLGGRLDDMEREQRQREEVQKEYGSEFDFDFVDSTIDIPIKKKETNKTVDALSAYLSKIPDNNKAYRLVKVGANAEDFALVEPPEHYVNTGLIIGIRVDNPYEQGQYLFMKGYLYKHTNYNKWGVMLNKNTSYYRGTGSVSNARAKCINEAVGDYTVKDKGIAFTTDKFFFLGLSRIMAYMWGLCRSDDLSLWEVNSVDTKYVKVKDNRILNAPLRKVLEKGLDAYVEPIK